jgi:uncharacterized membrane protein YdjX (TVP38/TMEM64 family)
MTPPNDREQGSEFELAHSAGRPEVMPEAGASWTTRIRLMVLAGAVGIGDIAATLLLILNAHKLAHAFSGNGVLNWFALLAVCCALVIFLFPYPILAAASGYRFGTAVGTALVMAALVLGAVASTALARWAGRGDGAAALGSRAARLARWLDARGFRAVLMARVFGVPFALVSYVAGFTNVALREVALATAIGVAPRAFAYTALGGSLHTLSRPEGRIFLTLSVILVIAAVVVPALMRRALGRRPGLAHGEPTVVRRKR